MNIKKMAGTAAIAAGLGVAGLGLGAGTAQADDGWIPGPGYPSGSTSLAKVPRALGAPGQLKKVCVEGPRWMGLAESPPGHWTWSTRDPAT